MTREDDLNVEDKKKLACFQRCLAEYLSRTTPDEKGFYLGNAIEILIGLEGDERRRIRAFFCGQSTSLGLAARVNDPEFTSDKCPQMMRNCICMWPS